MKTFWIKMVIFLASCAVLGYFVGCFIARLYLDYLNKD